jgi:hypothetical protein
MDRNLGASQRASSVNDFTSYGCLFQWGRGLDGAASMKWTSATFGTPLAGVLNSPIWSVPTCPNPDVSSFVKYGTNNQFMEPARPHDWLTPQDDTLWATGSVHDPCPDGYQVPSLPEIEAEAFSGRDDAFSRLALPGVNGALQSQSGILDGGLVSFYWSRTQGVNTRFNGDRCNAAVLLLCCSASLCVASVSVPLLLSVAFFSLHLSVVSCCGSASTRCSWVFFSVLFCSFNQGDGGQDCVKKRAEQLVHNA